MSKKLLPPMNMEAIRLYREIIRTANRFYWCNEQGESWSRVLRENARKEFEQAREEKDPLIIARLLVVGRDCLMETQFKFDQTEKKIREKVERTRNPHSR
mmetsp:Transcript_11771/g.18087  ORF Transcript_11771/g.18087 Transcript_11771/m.18087 type:complete len:100 (+) Transcript_11771:32-331(+)